MPNCHVVTQLTGGGERLAAMAARTRSLAGVSASMDQQRRSVSESQSAKLAAVRPLAGMDQLVDRKLVRGAKPPSASGADERSLVGVRHLVRLQRVDGLEAAATHVALQVPAGVVPFHVLLEVPLGRQSLAAVRTRSALRLPTYIQYKIHRNTE